MPNLARPGQHSLSSLSFSTASAQSAAATSAPLAEVKDTSPFHFDRRWETRCQTDGYARVMCSDPYHTFLGGTKTLVDFSEHGLGLLSDCAIPEGEQIEIRLAPFRVRGKFGTVVRCRKRIKNNHDNASDDNTPEYEIGVQFTGRHRAA